MRTGQPSSRPRWWERIRRAFNLRFTRGPALLRRMGIPVSDADPARRGFVIIQVDGLSHARLVEALRRRRMPFLRRLVRRGRLKLHRFLSELPTSTPAFQAGMFYGDNSEIPGFQFFDKSEGRHYRMGRSEFAYSVQQERRNPGLLRGGSVFSCVFTGDADSALFIFSTLTAPSRWKFVFRAWDILLLSVLYVSVFFRMVFLFVLELVLAVYDSVKWYLRRGIVRREVEFIAARVALTVIARESITVGATIDIYRGVPSIYVNYLGYDEHSHLRGPDSAVAKWTLLGIDRCIRKIHKATLFSERKYDFYVLSDHGQCPVLPFEMLAGEPLGEFLQARLAGMTVESDLTKDERAAQLGAVAEGMARIAEPMPRAFRRPIRAYGRFLGRRVARLDPPADDPVARLDIVVVSSGPVAYAYWVRRPEPLTAEDIDEMHPELLDQLADHPAVGFVSTRTESGGVLVHARGGTALIGENGVRVDGDLPFDASPHRSHVIEGIRRITRMRRAGDLCIWGAYAQGGNVSYSYEFGAHTGCTDDEITAFILAPPEADFDFASVTRHDQFYEFFSRYLPGTGETEEQRDAS